jgi:hypothetical protein
MFFAGFAQNRVQPLKLFDGDKRVHTTVTQHGLRYRTRPHSNVLGRHGPLRVERESFCCSFCHHREFYCQIFIPLATTPPTRNSTGPQRNDAFDGGKVGPIHVNAKKGLVVHGDWRVCALKFRFCSRLRLTAELLHDRQTRNMRLRDFPSCERGKRLTKGLRRRCGQRPVSVADISMNRGPLWKLQ